MRLISGNRSGVIRTAVVLIVLGIAAAVALVTGRSAGDGSTEATPVAFDSETGELSFRLERFDGEVLDSDELAGTPMVLNGYASWCGVCEREMPDFERVHRAAGDRVAIIGFNPQSNDSDAAQAQLVEETGITYPTVRDPGDRLLREFSPSGGLPVTVFVDGDGVVRKVYRGLLTEQMLRAEIRAVLGVSV
jgi:thiol-disulfide isomerase/thioredoxin